MVSIPSSLNKYIAWLEVATLIGITPQQHFPQSTLCPFCEKDKLTTYKDNKVSGEWHYCWSCRFRGDTIELLAKVWKLSLRATLMKVVKRGVDFPEDKLTAEAIHSYSHNFVKRRKHFRKFWKQCREQLKSAPSEEIRTINQNLGLRVRLTPQRWATGPGLLLGSCTSREAELTFHPNSATQGGAEHAPNKANHNPSKSRIFRGRKWGDVLVMATYDMPGRLSGFWFAGREGKAEKQDLTFKRICWGPPYYVGKPKPNSKGPRLGNGIGMASAVWNASQDWGNLVFVVDDPLTALRMQVAHFTTEARPLPIVCWFEHMSQVSVHDWDMWRNKQVIFWSPKPDSNLVRQAIWANGMISTAGPEEYSEYNLDRYIGRVRPDMILRRIQSAAKSWQSALVDQLPDMTNEEIEKLFLELEFGGLSTEDVLCQLDEGTKRRVSNIVNYQQSGKSVVVNGREIIEQSDGWHVRTKSHKGSLELLSSAVLRIDTVVCCNDAILYEGRVKYNNEDISFCERKEVVEKKTAAWLEEFLIKKDKGILNFKPGWSKHLVTIAKQFRVPELRKGVNMIGWDTATEAFVLPDGIVNKDGKRKLKTYFVADEAWIDSMKQRKVMQMSAPDRTVVEALFNLPDQDILWATLAVTLYNLIAGLLGHPRRDVVLSGEAAQAAGIQHAQAWGLPTRVLHRSNQYKEDYWGEHDLLSLAEPTATAAGSINRWVSSSVDYRGIMLPFGDLGSQCLLANGWLGITTGHARDKAERAARVTLLGGNAVLPGYLSWVTERGIDNICWEPAAGETLLDVILADLARYLDSLGGNGSAMEAVAKPVLEHTEEHAAQAFGHLIGYAVNTGKMDLIASGVLQTRSTMIVRSYDGDTAWFKPSQIQACLPDNPKIKLNMVRIEANLLRNKILLGNETQENIPGWVVKADWLHRAIRAQRKCDMSLKVVG